MIWLMMALLLMLVVMTPASSFASDADVVTPPADAEKLVHRGDLPLLRPTAAPAPAANLPDAAKLLPPPLRLPGEP